MTPYKNAQRAAAEIADGTGTESWEDRIAQVITAHFDAEKLAEYITMHYTKILTDDQGDTVEAVSVDDIKSAIKEFWNREV